MATQLAQQLTNPGLDLVADQTDRVQVLPGRVVERPLLVVLAREDRAGIPATHGDHHVCGAHGLVGPRLGELTRDVDPSFLHRLHHDRVDLRARLGSAGPPDRGVAGQVSEEAERHLGSAGVVHAQEQHDGSVVGAVPLHLGQRLEPLAGEPLGEQRQERGDAGVLDELLVGTVQEPLDGLRAVGAAELLGQPCGGILQCLLGGGLGRDHGRFSLGSVGL